MHWVRVFLASFRPSLLLTLGIIFYDEACILKNTPCPVVPRNGE